MKLIFLGTGTSTGVPQIGCRCKVCRSDSPKDKRLRASALLEVDGKNLLIDCGPDFRQQILALDSHPLDALLVTHTHYDHVGGVDDLRPYCHPDSFPVYCRADVAEDLRNRIPYSFAEHPYPGVPTFKIHVIRESEPFEIKGLKITPIPIEHFRLRILGFRIKNFAYITDCKKIGDEAKNMIRGLDTLVINALRTTEHMSHQTLGEALVIISEVKPRIAYLTHMSHQIGLHEEVAKTLPHNIRLAYDGLEINIPD